MIRKIIRPARKTHNCFDSLHIKIVTSNSSPPMNHQWFNVLSGQFNFDL